MIARLLLATTVAVTALTASTGPASAEGERQGNWDLYVDAAGCEYDWLDQAWCGPDLVVHADIYLTDDDLYRAAMRLIGPDGEVPLQYGSTARYNSGRGARGTDPNYWGPSFEKRTPTGGLAPGKYGVTLNIDVSGRWYCSMYSRDICNFLEPKNVTYAWVFDWAESSLQTPTINLVVNAETIVLNKGTSSPRVMLNAVVQPGKAKTQVTIQRKSEKGKWKTLAKRDSKALGLVTFTDKNPPKSKKVLYRLFATDAPDFDLTVSARTN